MFISKLKGLNQPQNFINRSSNWQIIDCNLSYILLVIDNEKTSISNTSIWDHNTIVFSNRMVEIRNQGNVHFA